MFQKGEVINTYLLLVRKSNDNGELVDGTSEVNIKMWYNKFGSEGVDWCIVVQIRIHWLAVETRVIIKLQVR
jgi:hypothetical protein